MASVTMIGPYTYGTRNIVYDVWHNKEVQDDGVVMSARGTFTATRNQGTITISANITITVGNSGWFNYPLWFYVKANGNIIHTWDSYWYNGNNWTYNLNLNGKGSSWSKTFESFEYNTNDAVRLSFTVHCANGTNEHGTCNQGYTYVDLIDESDGSTTLVNIPAYNPWSNPTNLSNVRVSPLSIKPEGSITISWNAAKSGTGNSIDKYKIAVSSNRFGWKYKEVGNVTSTTVKVRDLLDYDTQIRPGDIISVAVQAHYTTSSGSGHDPAWMSWVYADSAYNVSVFKSGIVYYQLNSSTRKDCVATYYQLGNTKKNVRYILVQNSSSSRKIIDEYTTHY